MAGFGYDAISNVYKVVRVVRLHSTDVDAPIGAEGTKGDGGKWTKRHESKPSSSIMSKYYENTSSTSGLTSEHKSKSKDRRHGDRHENRSSNLFSRNTFEDRYDPSESHVLGMVF
ncbi:hypothetical protein L484_007129 [Morus notabilis]|uniref:Uncharacterized protein n=1 Tax=Morus notabilis TaxID=981085 RepID=W9RU34_9ROSA|nr:hypothetical protein L484_007129 [Morus notabilis]